MTLEKSYDQPRQHIKKQGHYFTNKDPSSQTYGFPSISVFSSESFLHIRWPKYGRFSISPCNEYSGLISFSFDWLDLLAVQGILKSLL